MNEGADFYLQKGGDPKSQFTELSHKVLQAIRRKQAELSLKDSEQRLADIVDFLPDATFAIDRTGHVILWNRAIEEMTGIPAVEMIGKGDYDYAVPFYGFSRPLLIDQIDESDEKINSLYSNLYRNDGSLTAETGLTHPKGHQISVLAKVCHLYNQAGEIIGTIESIRDITGYKNLEMDLARKHSELQASYEQLAGAEEELREQYKELARNEQLIRINEERLISIYNTVGDAIFQLVVEPHEQYRFLSINSTFCRKTRFSCDQVIGRTVHELIPEPSLRTGLEKFRQAIKENTIVCWEDIFQYSWGQLIGEICISPLFDENNTCTYLIGSIHDISERKMAEDTLLKSKELLQLFIHDPPAALAMFDLEMRYLAASRRWMVDYHIGDRDIVGRSHYEIFPEIPEKLKEIHKRCLAGEVLSADDDKFERQDGSVQWVAWEVRPWFNADNTIGGIIIFSEDVTKWKVAEEELMATNEQLSAALEVLQAQYDKLALTRNNDTNDSRIGT